ncbi:MAG: MerR family transcriptional regulator [Nitratireductor sp.]
MNKSPDAFRTISEVAEDLDLPQHVLRFWETRFTQIKPMKRGGGRRYYRPDDVDLLQGIRNLLYDEGYTIRGVQRILKEQGNRYVIGVGSGEIELSESQAPTSSPDTETIESLEENAVQFESAVSQKAVSVKDLPSANGSKKGILNRLRGKDAPASAGGVEVSDEDRRNLQNTLYELLECKRLLDQVRSN